MRIYSWLDLQDRMVELMGQSYFLSYRRAHDSYLRYHDATASMPHCSFDYNTWHMSSRCFLTCAVVLTATFSPTYHSCAVHDARSLKLKNKPRGCMGTFPQRAPEQRSVKINLIVLWHIKACRSSDGHLSSKDEVSLAFTHIFNLPRSRKSNPRCRRCDRRRTHRIPQRLHTRVRQYLGRNTRKASSC